jgi:hypothetical protein
MLTTKQIGEVKNVKILQMFLVEEKVKEEVKNTTFKLTRNNRRKIIPIPKK